jgi:hypothetical protein
MAQHCSSLETTLQLIALITNAAGVPMPLYFFLNFFGMVGAKLRTFAQSKTHRFYFVLQLPLMLKF